MLNITKYRNFRYKITDRNRDRSLGFSVLVAFQTLAAASERAVILQTSLAMLDSLAVPWSCTCSDPTPHSSKHDGREAVNDAIIQ
jgi:hypothetical protein